MMSDSSVLYMIGLFVISDNNPYSTCEVDRKFVPQEIDTFALTTETYGARLIFGAGVGVGEGVGVGVEVGVGEGTLGWGQRIGPSFTHFNAFPTSILPQP